MIWRLRLFGIQIASLECDDDEPPPEGISGGATMCFDRDENPYSPDERWNWCDPEDGFGFR